MAKRLALLLLVVGLTTLTGVTVRVGERAVPVVPGPGAARAGGFDWLTKAVNYMKGIDTSNEAATYADRVKSLMRGYTLNSDGASVQQWYGNVESSLVGLNKKGQIGLRVADEITTARRFAGLRLGLRFAGRLAWPIALGVTAYDVYRIVATDENGDQHQLFEQASPGTDYPAGTVPAASAISDEWYYMSDGFYYLREVVSPGISWVGNNLNPAPAGNGCRPTSYDSATGQWSFLADCSGQVGRLRDGTSYADGEIGSIAGGDTIAAVRARHDAALAHLLDSSMPGATFSSSSGNAHSVAGCTATGGGNCIYRRATEAEMQGKVQVSPVGAGTSKAASYSTTYNITNSAITSAQMQDFVDQIKASNADTISYVQHELEPTDAGWTDPTTNYTVTVPSCAGQTVTSCEQTLRALDWNGGYVTIELSMDAAVPSFGPGAVVTTSPAAGSVIAPDADVIFNVNPATLPVELPAPGLNESYTGYIARLRALGYIGTITELELDPYDELVGPSAVSAVVVSGTTYQTALWPFPRPRIAPDTAITVRHNPETAPAVGFVSGGNTDGATPGDVPTPGGGVDFGPITGLDPGCKFPYGFICYAQTVTGWFDVTPAAPEFDMTVAKPALAGGGTLVPHYDVDLSNMDDYMAVWRGILSVVIWIGAVYLIATRMLGLHWGGDPGEAIDDA